MNSIVIENGIMNIAILEIKNTFILFKCSVIKFHFSPKLCYPGKHIV